MAWIQTVPFDSASGYLKSLYDRVKGPDNNVDNVLMVHSLRPHALEGHLALYKNVLHHDANSLPTWFLECIGLNVSLINGCGYCVDHHYEGLRRLLADDSRALNLRQALDRRDPSPAFDPKQAEALRYAALLTRSPADVAEDDVAALRDAGYDDGEILEINQVASYFAYANRTVLGLGVTTEGDVLGLSPADDDDDWGHR